MLTKNDIDTRNWSIMLSHMEMIRLFYESGYEYSVICEDDIYIHKDFKILVEDCIFQVQGRPFRLCNLHNEDIHHNNVRIHAHTHTLLLLDYEVRY